jgi:hypothetical protein
MLPDIFPDIFNKVYINKIKSLKTFSQKNNIFQKALNIAAN